MSTWKFGPSFSRRKILKYQVHISSCCSQPSTKKFTILKLFSCSIGSFRETVSRSGSRQRCDVHFRRHHRQQRSKWRNVSFPGKDHWIWPKNEAVSLALLNSSFLFSFQATLNVHCMKTSENFWKWSSFVTLNSCWCLRQSELRRTFPSFQRGKRLSNLFLKLEIF